MILLLRNPLAVVLLSLAASVAGQDLASKWMEESRSQSQGFPDTGSSQRVWIVEVASEKRQSALTRLLAHPIIVITDCTEAESWAPSIAVPCGQAGTAYLLSRAVLTSRGASSFSGRSHTNGLLTIEHSALGRDPVGPQQTAVLVVAPAVPKAVRISYSQAQ